MQSSESGYNTRYPREPNGITDPAYSIEVGVQTLVACLSEAQVENPIDMARIKLALQGYNYGNGFIPWAITNYGGYSIAAAVEFSDMQAANLGWNSYGDKQYAAHVLRYYPYGLSLIHISNEQMSYVTNADAGCGLIRYGSALVPFVNRFPKDTKLYDLMTTRPGEGVFGGNENA